VAEAESVLTRFADARVLFAAALAVRVAYLLTVGTQQAALFHPDSQLFVDLALSPDWWRGHPERMPGYPIFLHFHFLIFGADAFWAPVLSQLAIDAFACVAIARTAEWVRPGTGRWAGVAAALNPTQIVMASVVLGDSIFMACIAGGFLAMARWWRRGKMPSDALAVGLWFGLALFNRAIVWPFVPVLATAMLAESRTLRPAAIAVAVIAVFAAPVVVQNWLLHGKPALSAQGGMHMALWWYPLARESADGTPFAKSAGEVADEFARRGGRRDGSDWFGDEAIYAGIAREGLASVGPAGIAKAWTLGATINLASPATLMIPHVMALPRTGFYATPGATPVEKVWNFVSGSSSAAYLGWLAGGIVLEWPVRLLAVAGLAVALRRRELRAAGIFAVLWIGFVLAVQGPVASAKYRLLIEPLCAVLAAQLCRTRRAA
jgi:hypothetical protein